MHFVFMIFLFGAPLATGLITSNATHDGVVFNKDALKHGVADYSTLNK